MFRSRSQAISTVGFGLLSSLMLGSVAFRPEAGTVDTAVATAAALFLLAGSGRVAYSGVRFDRDEIKVVNPLRSHRIPRADARRFLLAPHGVLPRIGHLELDSGKTVHIWGIQAPNPLFRPGADAAEKIIAELNALLPANESEPRQSPATDGPLED